MSKYQSRLLVGCSAFTLITGLSDLGFAHAADKGGELETVIVTARKHSEDLLKVPVAVSVLTGKDLDMRGVETLNDIANFSPGVTIDQSAGGSARSDRSFQEVIIRGMTPSTTTNPTSTIFINGTPVTAADMIQNIDDAERVEVLKGPQSAYFGRSTFAGAINVITKEPGNTYGGYASAEYGTYDTRVFKGSVYGPIIEDKLSLRVGLSYDNHDGYYANGANPSQKLGSQETQSANFEIVAHPIENLSIKAYGMIFEDDDGPGATGIILSSQTDCTVNSLPFFCGTAPKLLPGLPAANTTFTPALYSLMSNNHGVVDTSDTVRRFGLKRDAYHADLNIDYVIPSLGLTLTSLTGINYDAWSELSDLSAENGPSYTPAYAGFPYAVEQVSRDVSQELRLTTDQSMPYRGAFGASYLEVRDASALGNPAYGLSALGSSGTKTTGFFFGLAYDVLPQFTLNFEGRYQIDDISSYLGNTFVKTGGAKYYNFLPRVSLQYKITPDIMAYATYSEGVNPATFNTQLSSLSPAGQAFFAAPPLNAQLITRPEKLTNYELGLKGKFLDGRATASVAIYHDIWTDQLVSNSFVLTTQPFNPYLAFNFPDLIGYQTNSGKTDLNGIEFDANLIPIQHVSINASAAVNDSSFDHYICLPCSTYNIATPGYNASVGYNAHGKELPNSSKYSATVGIQYANAATLAGASDWFVRGDFIYKSGVYLESDNITKLPDTERVNLRAGLNWRHASVEAYVDNLFNNKAYTSGFPDYDFQAGAFANYSALYVGLPAPVTAGVKLKVKF